MILQRHRRKPESVWEYIQILIGNEEEVVLAGRTQTPESRENHQFLVEKFLLGFFQKMLEDGLRLVVVNAVAVAVEIYQGIVLRPAGHERDASVRGIYGISLVGKTGWNHLSHESAQPRKAHLFMVEQQLADHLRK